MIRFLLCVLTCVCVAVPAGAANLVKTYSYFTVRGRTLDDIQNELSRHGPKVNTTGLRHPGATRMAFTTRIGYADEGNSCRIASAVVTVKVRVILPRWRPRGRTDKEVRIFWNTLAADIKRHEERHVEIAKQHGVDLEKALLAIGRQDTCKAAAAKAKEVTARVLSHHDRAQAEFDRVEGINFEDRILRLLRYRIERIENGRLPG
jgi:predicted secreted Zn-dependent protease